MTTIKNLKPLTGVDASATYLILISPENIPHLAIVHKGLYYSWTHKKVIISEPFKPYFNFLKRANRKMIFIALKDLNLNLESNFLRYKEIKDKTITCLLPIKDSLLPKSKADFIFELIPELYASNLIKESFYVNMKEDLNEFGDFLLSKYSKQAIYSYIESLNEKYAKRQ